MSRPKTGDRVTFSIPGEMLRWADSLAEEMALDRYDVIRLAISQGLLLLQMQREFAVDFSTYKKELQELVNSGDASGLANKLEEHMPARMERRAKQKQNSKKPTA